MVRRLRVGLVALLLLSVLPVSVQAAITHSATSKTIDNDGNASTTSGAFTPPAAGLVVVGLVIYGTPPTVSNCQLDGSTSFTADKTAVSGALRVALYSLANVSNASHSVTCTYSGNADFVDMFVSRFAGAATSSQTDGTGATGSGFGTSVTTGVFTTTNSDDVWVCQVGGDNDSGAYTAGSGWTLGDEESSSGNIAGGIEYQIVSGSTSGSCAMTAPSSNWVAVAIAYKSDGGGPPPAAAPRGLLTLGVG